MKKKIAALLGLFLAFSVCSVNVFAKGESESQSEITEWSASLLGKTEFAVGEDVLTSIEEQLNNERFVIYINKQETKLQKDVDYTIDPNYYEVQTGTGVSTIVSDPSTIKDKEGNYCAVLQGKGEYEGKLFTLEFKVMNPNSIAGYNIRSVSYSAGEYSKFISDLQANKLQWDKTSNNTGEKADLKYNQDYYISGYCVMKKEAADRYSYGDAVNDVKKAFDNAGFLMATVEGKDPFTGKNVFLITINEISNSSAVKVNINSTSVDSVKKIISGASENSALTNPGLKVSVTDSSSSNEEKTAIANALPSDYVTSTLLDINLYVVANETGAKQVTEAADQVELTLSIPENIQATDREYKVVRVHGDEAQVIKTVTPDEGSSVTELTISTDKFSTYAIAYQDKTSSEKSVSYSFTNDVKLYDKSTQSGLVEGKYPYGVYCQSDDAKVTDSLTPTLTASNGVITATEVNYTQAGTYRYSIYPDADANDKEYTAYLTQKVTVIVEVKDTTDGVLSASAYIGEESWDESQKKDIWTKSEKNSFTFYDSDDVALVNFKATLQLDGVAFEEGKYALELYYYWEDSTDWEIDRSIAFDKNCLMEYSYGENAYVYGLENPGDAFEYKERYKLKYTGETNVNVEDKVYEITYKYYIDENGKFHIDAPGLDNMVFKVASKDGSAKTSDENNIAWELGITLMAMFAAGCLFAVRKRKA